MFRGEFALTMDAKGRLAVPSRSRERLSDACGGKLVVTISLLERCLVAYPFPDWQRIEDEIKALREVAMTRAPEATAKSSANELTPPEPWTCCDVTRQRGTGCRFLARILAQNSVVPRQ